MEHTKTQFTDLAALVVGNLQDQHNWTKIETYEPHANDGACSMSRPILSGLPPRRLYIHPDEQIEALQAGDLTVHHASQQPEFEWVVAVHISEKLSLRQFQFIFDSVDTLPPNAASMIGNADCPPDTSRRDWRGSDRHKRLLLGVVHNDSTVSYYVLHDGIVKPRQN